MAIQSSLRWSLVLISATVLMMTSCSGSSEEENGEMNEEFVSIGQEIFESNCVACHGYDGKAGVGGAIDLTKSTLDEEGIKDVINNGRKAMVSQKHAYNTDEELQELVNYVISFREVE